MVDPIEPGGSSCAHWSENQRAHLHFISIFSKNDKIRLFSKVSEFLLFLWDRDVGESHWNAPSWKQRALIGRGGRQGAEKFGQMKSTVSAWADFERETLFFLFEKEEFFFRVFSIFFKENNFRLWCKISLSLSTKSWLLMMRWVSPFWKNEK